MAIALTHLDTREATTMTLCCSLMSWVLALIFGFPSGVLLITSARRRNECPGPRRAVKWKGENR